MPKILIFGMHRSGTTLLSDIIRKHPDVEHVFHESVLIDQDLDSILTSKKLPDYKMIQTQGELTRASNVVRYNLSPKFDMAESTWGAKMSYPGPAILQEWQRSTLDYAKTWLSYFEEEARIIHIVRHPYDVYLSSQVRWAEDQGHIANYGEVTLDRVCRDWCYTLDTLAAFFKHEARIKTLRFESLLDQPHKELKSIFSHADLAANQPLIDAVLSKDLVFFGKIQNDRARRYQQTVLDGSLCKSTKCLLEPYFEYFDYEFD